MFTSVIIFSLSTFLFFIQKEKKILKMGGLIFTILLLLFTANNPDYGTYEMIFLGEIPQAGNIEKGLFAFVKISNFLAWLGIRDYRVYLAMIGGFLAYVFYRWGKYTKNIYFSIYFYTLFVMYYDVIQVRNAIAEFLCMLGMLVIIEKKNDIFLFIICLMAVLFHPLAALTALLLIYIRFKSPQNDYSLSKAELLFFFIAGTANILFGRKVVMALMLNISFFKKAFQFIRLSAGSRSFIIWFTANSVQLFILWNYGVRYILSNSNHHTPIKTKRAVNLLFRFSIFAVILSGMTLYMWEIARVYRLFFLAMFLLYAVMRDELRVKNKLIIFLTIYFVNIAFTIVWISMGFNFDLYW